MLILSLLSNPFQFIIFITALVVTVCVHEFMHAKVADMLGDPTPELAGRVTLDPRAHLDPLGSLLFLLVGFGWGKPVPFDPFNLKNPRKDAAIISVVGPLSNFIMAIVGAVVLRLLPILELSFLTSIGLTFFEWFVRLNITLGIFNLLPFAPLDGFKFVGGLLSERQAKEWYGLERYGMLFLLFFIFPFVGGRSMLELFVLPVVGIVTGVLLP